MEYAKLCRYMPLLFIRQLQVKGSMQILAEFQNLQIILCQKYYEYITSSRTKFMRWSNIYMLYVADHVIEPTCRFNGQNDRNRPVLNELAWPERKI